MARPKKNPAASDGAASGSVNKAELIRQTARAMGKTVRPRDIIAKLKEQGVTVSSPQISKTLKSAGFKRKARGRRAAAAKNGASETSKAERIRQVAKTMGKKVRPRDIIAKLAEEGVTVSSAQVSSTLSAAGYRRKRRSGRKAAAAVAAAKPVNSGLDVEALIAAKALISKVGSVARAEAALSVLKKLQ